MYDIPKMKNYGIYITDNLIRFARVRAVTNLKKQAPIKEEEINIASLGQEEIAGTLKKFLKRNRISPGHLTLVLPRTQASIRHFSLPSVNDSELGKMIQEELKKLFPYNPQDLIFDYTLIRKRPDGYTDIMLVAIPREALLKQLSILKEAGLTPDAIEISSISLFNQLSQERVWLANYLLINFDDNFMDIIQLSEGQLVFSRGANFKGVLQKEEFFKNFNLTTAVLRDKTNRIDGVVLSGRGVDFQDLALSLEKAIPYKVEINDTLTILRGLGLEDKQDILRLDLLPVEFKIQRKKEKKQRSLFYFIALLFLNLSLIANILFLKMRARDEYLYLIKSEVKKIDTQTAALQRNMLKAEVFQDYLKASRLTLGLLSDLYRLAPEGVYLNSLSIFGKKPTGTMVIIGQAKDSEMVIKFANALKESAFINRVDINYITKKEPMVEFKILAAI